MLNTSAMLLTPRMPCDENSGSHQVKGLKPKRGSVTVVETLTTHLSPVALAPRETRESSTNTPAL